MAIHPGSLRITAYLFAPSKQTVVHAQNYPSRKRRDIASTKNAVAAVDPSPRGRPAPRRKVRESRPDRSRRDVRPTMRTAYHEERVRCSLSLLLFFSANYRWEGDSLDVRSSTTILRARDGRDRECRNFDFPKFDSSIAVAQIIRLVFIRFTVSLSALGIRKEAKRD